MQQNTVRVSHKQYAAGQQAAQEGILQQPS